MSRAWHGLLAMAVLAALVLQVALILTGGRDVNAVDGVAPADLETRLLRFFSYFTVQSNLLVLAASASLAWDPRIDGRVWRVLRLDALLGIAVTGIVFVTVLLPLVELDGLAAWANAGLHYVAPVGTLVGWWLFGPRPRIDGRTLALAFAWPVAWLACTLVHGHLDGWYPYPFLDAAELGYARVGRNVAAILAGACALAVALQWIERRRPATEGAGERPRHGSGAT